MSLWTALPQDPVSPCDRYKHACCSLQGAVYLLGGRGTHCLKDLWRYSVVRNEWTQLPCKGESAPEELEDHSMVAHEGFLYVFGGSLDCAYSGLRCPLWVFDVGNSKWVSWQGKKSVPQMPTNRRSHSAVVFESSMLVYGGYVDMRGSSQEFWRLDLDLMSWSLLAPGGPGPRHSHCAVAHQDNMYLYGGLRGLREQRDLWSWSSGSRSWSCLKTTRGPARLLGHAAVLYRGGLLLFGGGHSANAPLNALWRFSFSGRSWERLALCPGAAPPPARVHHCCVGLGPSYQPPAPGSAAGALPPGPDPKPRPFRNRCFPSPLSYLGSPPGGAIELDTFERTEQGPSGEGGRSGLAFQNQAFSGEGGEEGGGDVEDLTMEDVIAQNLPDILLLLGGKPLGQSAALSVWQMTLTDP